MSRPLVTVYVPCHNYGCYLDRAVESVKAQSLDSWEVILIDEGSSDDSADKCWEWGKRLGDRCRVWIHERPRGLAATANRVLEEARGKYIMRLDADDWLDESALLVMAQRLEARSKVALVYPNYVYVDEQGRTLGIERRKKVGKEARLLDLPAHGACTMVRRRVLKSLGGYDEGQRAQDGYDLWLKVVRRYAVENVGTPLFYYRQHDGSMSSDEERILSARRRIKRRMVERQEGSVKPRVLGVIPAKNTYSNKPNIVLEEVGGRALIEHTLKAAQQSDVFDDLWVTTDCQSVVDYCGSREVDVMMRPAVLSRADRQLSEVVFDAVTRLEGEEDRHPDIVVVLSLHSPLRREGDIVKAVDSLRLYEADSVISVYEDYDLHFSHGRQGLEPINPAMMQRLRPEREGLYVYNGAITASWRDVLTPEDMHGTQITHVVMPRRRSIQLKSRFDRWMLDEALKKGVSQSQ